MTSIQPRPYGSAFTVAGACGSPVLTSTISPDTGANRSETALTDSTTPNGFFAVAVAPTFGSSTKTTSPSCSAAYAVMPTRTRSSSRLAHSWSRVYRSSFGTCAIVTPSSPGADVTASGRTARPWPSPGPGRPPGGARGGARPRPLPTQLTDPRRDGRG